MKRSSSCGISLPPTLSHIYRRNYSLSFIKISYTCNIKDLTLSPLCGFR